MPTIDDMNAPGGEGPFCKDCWTDIWVKHPYGGRSTPGMPECKFGVKWSPQEWTAIQKIVTDTINAFTQPPPHGAQRYPRPEEIDVLLQKHFQFSRNCPFCKADVVFYPTSGDFNIPGVNAAIQQQQ